MSEASEELKKETGGDVPTPDQVIAATAEEAADTAWREYASLQAGIRREPLRSVFIAAGVGYLAALLARRL